MVAYIHGDVGGRCDKVLRCSIADVLSVFVMRVVPVIFRESKQAARSWSGTYGA